MSSNTFTCEALAEPAKQQQHEVGKEEAPKVGGEKKRNSNKRGERRRDKKAEGAATPKGIKSPSPQPPTPGPTVTHLRAPTPPIAPTTTNTTVDPSALREDDQPISASTLVNPLSFTFGPITRAFGQPPPASLPIVPSVINPSPFGFGRPHSSKLHLLPHPKSFS